MLSTLHTRDNSVSSAVKADFKGNELKTMPHSQHSSYREIDEGMNVYVGACACNPACVCVCACACV